MYDLEVPFHVSFCAICQNNPTQPRTIVVLRCPASTKAGEEALSNLQIIPGCKFTDEHMCTCDDNWFLVGRRSGSLSLLSWHVGTEILLKPNF